MKRPVVMLVLLFLPAFGFASSNNPCPMKFEHDGVKILSVACDSADADPAPEAPQIQVSQAFDCTPQPGQHCAALSWTASPTPGVTYTAYRSTSSPACGTTKIATGITGTTFVDNQGLLDGQTYFWTVSAVATGGAESKCSNEATFQIPVSPSPASALSVVGH